MAFTFDAIFAVDPNNPNNAARNAAITIFNPADATQAAITITDPTGSPLPNPITVDAAGMGPAFQHPTLARVGWKGAGFVGYFTSYEGMYNETVAAKDAAQAAAVEAGEGAAVVLAARIAAGEFVGAPGKDGANILPTDTAIKQAIEDAGSATRQALNTTILAATGGKANTAAVASFSTLKAALEEGARSTAVQILGDSTGNETSEWVYKFAQAIKAGYPAWTFKYKVWDDATQNYGVTTTLQTGAGDERSLSNAVGTTPRRLDTTVSTNITGTIDARVKLSMSDWTPGAQVNLGGRSGGAGFRGWYMFVNTAGVPGFVYSVDGTALTTVFGTATVGIADGTTTWLRYLFNPNDGAGNRVTKFYKSTDNVTWTQIGATVTTAGAVTVHQPVWGYELGGNAGGVISPTTTTVNIFEVEFRNGENGPNVVPALPDLWPPYDLNAIRVSGAPVLTFVNGSKAGGDSAYLGDTVRLPKLTPAYGQSVTLISNSHNEGLAVDKVWLDKYEALRQAVEARLPGASTVILTQNPETSGTTWYREHRARRLNLLGYARAKGVDIIDSYRAFLDYGAAWETDLMQDAVHPNPAGSDLWAATVKEAFDATA